MNSIYKEIKILGSGAFGTTYLVQSLQSKRFYALKKIKINKLSKFQQTQISKEISIMQSLNHPYIVKFYDSYQTSQHYSIKMSFANGGDLSAKKTLQTDQITIFLTQILLGLDYLHRNCRILHRDIKIENILINDEQAQICDFGLSKLLLTNQDANTQCGTPIYFSPELAKGNKYNQKSDIWSCGIMLYKLIFDEFPIKIRNRQQLVNEICAFKGVQKGGVFKLVLDKMLVVNENERYNAEQLLQMEFFRQPLDFLYNKNQKAGNGVICDQIWAILHPKIQILHIPDDLQKMKEDLNLLVGEERFYQIIILLSNGQLLSQAAAGLSVQTKNQFKRYIQLIIQNLQ